jgi:hypothetical protein
VDVVVEVKASVLVDLQLEERCVGVIVVDSEGHEEEVVSVSEDLAVHAVDDDRHSFVGDFVLQEEFDEGVEQL